MTNQRLDKTRILHLLAEADAKWFSSHSGQFKYRDHLEFIADYIARNYHRRGEPCKINEASINALTPR